mgnify:CR=1 FL=1
MGDLSTRASAVIRAVHPSANLGSVVQALRENSSSELLAVPQAATVAFSPQCLADNGVSPFDADVHILVS